MNDRNGTFLWDIPITCDSEDWGAVEFAYTTLDPLEIVLTFPLYAYPTKVSRDLVCLGMSTPQGEGEGDVHVGPHPDGIAVTVTAVDQIDERITCTWVLDRMHLGLCLSITGDMMPFGREDIDLDEELAELLGGER